MHSIILYYKYVVLSDPTAITLWQKALCEKLGLKGRVIVAAEGVNGTLEGTVENIKQYKKAMKTFKDFSDINFKISSSAGNSFPKLSVKTRKEIVTLGRPKLFPTPGKTGGDYISAENLHELLEKRDENVVVLDMRNDYEAAVGKFEGSVVLPVKNFKEIPGMATELQKLKNKTVVAVCTGGVRCEKGTAYLKSELGFEKIYQLHDGIVTYMNKYPKGHFKGSLYVFDGRVTLRAKGMSDVKVGVCELCSSSSEKYVNCSKKGCHRHFIICTECLEKKGGEEKVLCCEPMV